MSEYKFPETLIGDDIILEKLSEFHIDDLYEMIDRNREHIKKYLPWLTNDYSKESLEKFVDIQGENWDSEDEFTFIIINKESDLPMGSIGVSPRYKGTVELGYYLGEEYTGKGYLSQAIDLLTDFAFNEDIVERIFIACEEDNKKSAAVALRNGFAFEGVILNKRVDEFNGPLDMLHFVKLKDEVKMQKLKDLEPKLKDVFNIK